MSRTVSSAVLLVLSVVIIFQTVPYNQSQMFPSTWWSGAYSRRGRSVRTLLSEVLRDKPCGWWYRHPPSTAGCRSEPSGWFRQGFFSVRWTATVWREDYAVSAASICFQSSSLLLRQGNQHIVILRLFYSKDGSTRKNDKKTLQIVLTSKLGGVIMMTIKLGKGSRRSCWYE